MPKLFIQRKKQLDALFEQKEYAPFVQQTLDLTYKYIHYNELFEENYKLLKKALLIEKQYPNIVDTPRGFILNAIGVLCFHNYRFGLTISFFFVAFLRVKASKHFFYYHNSAGVLRELGAFEAAIQNHDVAIELIEKTYQDNESKTEKEQYFSRINHYKLDKVSTLIKANKVNEAFELYATIDLKLLPQFCNISVEAIEAYSAFYEGDIKLFKEKSKDLKEKFKKDNKYRFLMNLNKFMLKNDLQLNEAEKEKILIENVEAAVQINYKKIEEQAIIELITFYKAQGNRERELEYFELLYDRSIIQRHQISYKLIDLYLSEITECFNEFKTINSSLSAKKSELEDITHILSHDLKTPLRSICSFAALLQKDIDKNDYSRLGEHLDFIQNSSEYLYDIINDINALSKIEKSFDKEENLDLNEIAQSSIQNLDKIIQQKNAKVFIERLPKIKANPIAISILFQNMIDNGVKYNKSETPTLHIAHKLNKDFLSIIFADNGIGIHSDYFSKIFTFFKRLHHEEEYEGTGFGLGICKKIVDQYRGEIEISSEIGKGSTFEVKFPVKLLSN